MFWHFRFRALTTVVCLLLPNLQFLFQWWETITSQDKTDATANHQRSGNWRIHSISSTGIKFQMVKQGKDPKSHYLISVSSVSSVLSHTSLTTWYSVTNGSTTGALEQHVIKRMCTYYGLSFDNLTVYQCMWSKAFWFVDSLRLYIVHSI